MSVGLKRNTVILESFSVEWDEYFQLEKNRILEAIKDKIHSIEHVGSTSIKNSIAKPIIDICIGIESYSAGFECVEKLLFRDYLNYHPEDLKKYNELKEQLKEKRLSREEYTRRKDPLINEILIKAKRWKEQTDLI